MELFELSLPKNYLKPVSKWDNVYSAVCAAVKLIEKSGYLETKTIPTTFALGSRSALVFLSMVYIECKKDMGEELTAPEKQLDSMTTEIIKNQPGILVVAGSRIKKYIELADSISRVKRVLRKDERLLLMLVEKFVPLWNSLEALPYSLNATTSRG